MSAEPVTWSALRQVHALRESVVWCLAGLAVPSDEAGVGHWIESQGLSCTQPELKPSFQFQRAISDAFEAANDGSDLAEMARASHCPDLRLDGIGAERSGAGWHNSANFIVTSAFLRLLGAEEQFETDVLKALFYYRPTGLVNAAQLKPVTVEADVILEEPVKDARGRECYSKPHLWTWLRKQADNRMKRAEIFKRVFDITVIPQDYDQNRKNQWYDKRNKIAHGFAGVAMTLAEYVEVEVFVAKTVMSVRQQCQDKLKVTV